MGLMITHEPAPLEKAEKVSGRKGVRYLFVLQVPFRSHHFHHMVL